MNRDTKKKRTPFEAIDFVPGAKRTPKKIDGRELKAKLQVAFAGLSGLKNKSQKAQGNARNAPRNRERNERTDVALRGGVVKRGPSHRSRPNKKHNNQRPEDE